MHRIAVILGDGIGKEVIPAMQRVVEAAGVKVEWVEALAGELAVEKYGTPVPDETAALIRDARVGIKGPLTNLVGRGWPSPNVMIRSKLGLFAQARHARYIEGSPTPFHNVDVIVVREATEDTYAGVEQWVGPDASIAIKYITRAVSEQVARFALDYARRMGRKRVTVTHKANVLKLTDGLFLSAAQDVAKEYPDIICDNHMIDNMCYQLVKAPQHLDVILAPNVYGDIVSDLAAGVAGSLGLGYGGNFNNEIALFEATHGTAPDIAGKGIANPIATILSGAMMMSYLGEQQAAERIVKAVEDVMREGKVLTGDLGGKAGTTEMTNAIIHAMKQ